MKYTDISTILNSEIVANALGQSVTVAEDLSNIVEFGTAVGSLSADALKNFTKSVIAGVYTYAINRMIETKEFKLLRDSQTYGGCLQRIMNKGLLQAKSTDFLNPQPNVNYWDGQWYGPDVDSKLYEETKSFKTIISLSEDALAQWFNNAQDTDKLISMIYANEKNTVKFELMQLEKRVVVSLAYGAVTGSRALHLITLFNNNIIGASSSADPNWKDITAIKADRDLMAYFQAYCKECIMRAKDRLKDVQDITNDGTVITWSRDEDIKAVFISEFLNDMAWLGSPIQYHDTPLPLTDYETITAWQNAGNQILADYTLSTTITVDNNGTPASETDIVGVLYDIESAGVTLRSERTVAEGPMPTGHINFHHNIAYNYFVDTRLSSIALCLD